MTIIDVSHEIDLSVVAGCRPTFGGRRGKKGRGYGNRLTQFTNARRLTAKQRQKDKSVGSGKAFIRRNAYIVRIVGPHGADGGIVRMAFASKIERMQDLNLIKAVKTSGRKTVSSKIDDLYNSIKILNQLLSATPNDRDLSARLATSISELRRLQNIEAEAIERRFNRSLRLPLGMGAKAIEDADALIKRYENIAVKNTAAE